MFLRGPSLGARFLLLAAICISFMLLDTRYNQLDKMRSAITTAIYPLRVVAHSPYVFTQWAKSGLRTRRQLTVENSVLRNENQEAQFELQRLQQLESENHRLRVLLESAQAQQLNLQMAEIMRVSLDPGRHHVILNQGAQLGINKGQAVIDAEGLMGQILRTDPLQAEAILITDSNHVTPIEVNRNGLRSIAYGYGDAQLLNLPYFAQNAEIRVGDLLVTSGLGGRFPVGIPVAEITEIKRDPSQTFLKVIAAPVAAMDQSRLVAVVKSDTSSIRAKARNEIPTDESGIRTEVASITPSDSATQDNNATIESSATQ
jgi:rod shape-determining protein MreC